LSTSPQEENSSEINVLPGVGRESLRDTFENGFERSTRMTNDRREDSKRFRDDSVLFMNLQDRLKMCEKIRVVFDLYLVNEDEIQKQ
jgi:hypothetical protein